MHLLQRLLDKNPATRMRWGELLVHPFWQVQFPSLDMPPEPAFEAFIRKNNLLPANGEMRDSVDKVRPLAAAATQEPSSAGRERPATAGVRHCCMKFLSMPWYGRSFQCWCC